MARTNLVPAAYCYRSSSFVAVKITRATEYSRSNELAVYTELANSRSGETRSKVLGRENVVALLDSFSCNGPNGTHLCLVYEVMGPPAESMLYASPICQDGPWWKRRFPTAWSRRMLRDVLLGLNFLHTRALVHGDLHLGNILLTVKGLDITDANIAKLQQQPADGYLLERLDGLAVDASAPTYIPASKDLLEYVSFELRPLAKIADLGEGTSDCLLYRISFCFWILSVARSVKGGEMFMLTYTLSAFPETKAPVALRTPSQLRAPEAIIGGRLGRALDIWSFGCLMFELVTGHSLFSVDRLEGNRFDEETNHEHLIQITEIIQPLPKVLSDKWRRAGSYYSAAGERLDTGDNSVDAGYSSDHSAEPVPLASSKRYESLEAKFAKNRPGDMDEAEGTEVVRILRRALQTASTRRASVCDLLREPWFSDGR